PGDIADQHATVADGLHRNGGKSLGALQVSAGIDAGDHVLPLHFAGGGEEVVLAHGAAEVIGGNPVGSHLHRVQRQAHGEYLIAENFCLSHAWQGGQLGLDDPRQVVGNLRVGQLVAVEADIHA